MTGWRVVAVAGLIPDDVFFDHLANRCFPAGGLHPARGGLDYLEEPDVFHDVFGHVPLLADPVYAAFLEAYGEGGPPRSRPGPIASPCPALLVYGRIRLGATPQGLRIFGAGIVSSPAETHIALEARRRTGSPSISTGSCARNTRSTISSRPIS